MNKPHKHAEVIKAWADGADIEYWSRSQGKWEDVPNPVPWSDNFQYRIKPPAPKWPETTMSDDQLIKAWDDAKNMRLTAVANAAIAHALENGQVLLPSDISNGIDRLMAKITK